MDCQQRAKWLMSLLVPLSREQVGRGDSTGHVFLTDVLTDSIIADGQVERTVSRLISDDSTKANDSDWLLVRVLPFKLSESFTITMHFPLYFVPSFCWSHCQSHNAIIFLFYAPVCLCKPPGKHPIFTSHLLLFQLAGISHGHRRVRSQPIGGDL